MSIYSIVCTKHLNRQIQIDDGILQSVLSCVHVGGFFSNIFFPYYKSQYNIYYYCNYTNLHFFIAPGIYRRL